MPTSTQEQHAQTNTILVVHIQKLDGSAALGCHSVDDPLRPEREVLSPRVLPGMIKGYDEIGRRIKRRDIRTLLEVTANATQT